MGVIAVDLNNDGRYELITTSCGHYRKLDSFVNILFDPDGGYPEEKQISVKVEGTTGYPTVADMRGTGNLDLILPFYTTADSRVLPLRIFYSDGKGSFDFDHPLRITCESSISSLALDLNRNGYPDLLICCHRNDLGHTVDSLLYPNGPDGLDLEHPQRLLGYGPHVFTRSGIFNMLDRSESEFYTSCAVRVDGGECVLSWEAETPNDTALFMRVRFADDEQQLGQAAWSEPVANGEILTVPAWGAVMQYQAELFAPNACGSPSLTRVELRSV